MSKIILTFTPDGENPYEKELKLQGGYKEDISDIIYLVRAFLFGMGFSNDTIKDYIPDPEI